LWASVYKGAAADYDTSALAVSPDGGTVFVNAGDATVASKVKHRGWDFADNAATGVRQWVSHYQGPGSPTFAGGRDNQDYAKSVTISSGGRSVYVTGQRRGTRSFDYATVAYNAATGKQRWVKRYKDPRNCRDVALGVAASPTGRNVYVTGFSSGISSGPDYTTIAYNAAGGTLPRRPSGRRSGRFYSMSPRTAAGPGRRAWAGHR
jgi:hypothetical protein